MASESTNSSDKFRLCLVEGERERGRRVDRVCPVVRILSQPAAVGKWRDAVLLHKEGFSQHNVTNVKIVPLWVISTGRSQFVPQKGFKN